MLIELDKRTIHAIAVEVAKLLRGEGANDQRLIPCREAAERLGISMDRLRKIKDDDKGTPRFSYIKRGEGQRARLYFDADRLMAEYQALR